MLFKKTNDFRFLKFSRLGTSIARYLYIMRLTAKQLCLGALLVILITAGLYTIILTKGGDHSKIQTAAKVYSILDKEWREDKALLPVISDAILRLSDERNLDPLLILAIIKVESSFRTEVRSHRGAIGLMQVKPIALKDLLKDKETQIKLYGEELHEPILNLQVGIGYLSKLLKKSNGDLWKALMAYNIGPTAVSRHYKNRPVPASGYPWKVMRTYHGYCNL